MIDVLAAYPNLSPAEALQAGLDAGGWVYAGPGDYFLADTLRVSERTRLTLDPRAHVWRTAEIGMCRNRQPGDATPGYTGRGDLLIEGGVWHMQGHATGATAVAASAFTLAHAENVTLRDLTIMDVPGSHGVDLIACRDVTIDNVRFLGYRDTGGRAFSEAIQIDGSYGDYSGDSAPADATPCDDVTITRCRFDASINLPGWGRAVGSHGYADDVAGHEHRGIKVIGNTIVDTLMDGVWAWKWRSSLIRGNQIASPGHCGIGVMAGCWDLDIDGNQIYDSGRHGIWVDASNNLALQGNRIVGAGRSTHNAFDGIRVSGNSATMLITDNRVRRGGPPNDTRWGLNIENGQRMVHHGNYLIWSGVSGPVRDLSTSPVTSAADAV